VVDSSEHIERVLDQCVQQMQQGTATLDDCLARYPAHRDELAELLPLAVHLRQAPQVTLSPASVQAGRRQLLEQLPPRPRPRWSFRSVLPLGWRQGGQPLFAARRLSMAWILVIATVVSLMAGGGAVYAADAAVPGDALYGLDRAVESVRLGLARDPEAVFALQLRFAEERLEEAGQLYATGDAPNMKKALAGYGESLAAAVRQMAGADETEGEALRLRLQAAAARHEEIFYDMGAEEPAGDQLHIWDRDRDCWCLETSEEIHPVAQDIADMYGYEYEDVIGWFCEGAGLGEIMLAVNLSLETGLPVGDLLLLREDGQGWGQIMRDYDLIGGSRQQGPPEESDQLDEGEPGRKPEDAGPPDEVPGGPPDGVPVGPPDEAPVGPPDEAPVGPPDEAPVGPPDEGAGGQPDEAPVGPPDEGAGGQPDEAPVGSPDEAPVGSPEEAPVGPPDEAPVGPPDEEPGSNGGGGQGPSH
jgi:hypothetical protein